jgi:Leucine-rich repeat (LRR) protein
MKRFELFLLVAFTGLIMASGCSNDDPVDTVKLPDPTEFTVTPATIAAGTASGTYGVNVACHATWTATSSADWCSLVKGDGAIIVTVDENTSMDSRTATITVTDNVTTRTVSVTQAMPGGMVKCTAGAGGTVTFHVTAKSIIVNWGDGSTAVEYNNLNNAPVSHIYAVSGSYPVRMRTVELSYFRCHNAYLTDLDVSNCPTLEGLDCRFNRLSALEVSNNTALTFLDCSNNQICALDVSNNTGLTELGCGGNLLSALDVSNNTALTYLGCHANRLDALDVSMNRALTWLDCYDNRLSALVVLNHTALTYLNCFENQLSALDVSKNTGLTVLDCGANRLSALDVSKNTALARLSCFNNRLSALDVSNNMMLALFDCRFNRLDALDVSNHTGLTELSCNGNLLSALDVSGNTGLRILNCSDNRLSVDALNKIFMDLPDSPKAVLMAIGSNPGTDTCDRSVAENKNWNVI